jgi:hypothetical protein
MSQASSPLTKIQAYATIFSAVAVPLLIAFFGWMIQLRASDEGVRKDYVQMAVGLLSSPATAGDSELRQWAVMVLDKSSPVPFSAELRTQLETGAKPLVVVAPYPMPPALLMEPPRPLRDLGNPEEVPSNQMAEAIASNHEACLKNSIQLESLQDLIKAYGNIHPDADKAQPSVQRDGSASSGAAR